ncbi:MAG: glycosyltransferase family 2 protein [Planctomycetes bacterium]|nr:glycosyltransferase family 2 protein [Planctomycetota bacterium]
MSGTSGDAPVELSLLLVNYNTWQLCVAALRTFAEYAPTRADGSPMGWEAIVVDNASPLRDPAAEAELRQLCEASGGRFVQHDDNAGYSKGMNLALRHARGQWLLVSNPDVEYRAGTTDRLLRAMERDASIGAAMPAGFFDRAMTGRLPPNILPTLRDLIGNTLGDLFPWWCRRYSHKRTVEAVRIWTADRDVELSMLSGACFLMNRSLIDEIGFFDERFPLYYEDTDLSVRIRRAGRRIVQVHGSELIHFYDRSGQTNHAEKMRRYWTSRRLYFRKWYGRLGALVYDACRKALESSWGQRRRQVFPQKGCNDLGDGHGWPVIEIEVPRQRLLVEFALDPKFFLAAGVLTSGRRWVPPHTMMGSFGPTTYWFRVVDLDQPTLPVIGVWRYALRYPIVALENGPEASAEAKRIVERAARAEAGA